MDERSHQYATTSGVLAWTAHTTKSEPSIEEELGDADEPPDSYATVSPLTDQFRRTSLRRPSEQHESLLTKALQSHSDDDDQSETTSVITRRRRSMTSNTSLASATDVSCDTGVTTPARTSTPSPRLPGGAFVHYALPTKQAPVPATGATTVQQPAQPDAAVEALKKKRCISFACAAKPKADAEPEPAKPAVVVSKPAEPAPQRRTCIRFACPTQKSAKATSPERTEAASTPIATTSPKKESPSTVVKLCSPSATRLSRPLLMTRRSSKSPVAVRSSKKWLTADSKDLDSESSKYHAFASDVVEEDDWIRRDQAGSGRITINDTLKKENAIRKLGEEAEEEEEMEDQLEDEADNENGDEEDDDNDEETEDVDAEEDGDDAELDDDLTIDGSDVDGGSDGYNTDNEVGFAESEEEDDDLDLWTTGGLPVVHQPLVGATPVRRRSSFAGELHSDSSVYGKNKPRTKAKRMPRAATPELPDSTDFVCGTLDEDRPLEEAYVSRMVARRKEKLHPIPQDIDPSFPTSEPEDEAEELYEHGHGSDNQVFGDMEDVSDAVARKDRRKQNASPKRYHSPPPKRHGSPTPKRHHSPTPKARGRSPRRLFDGHSPRRLRSPPPQAARSPAASPIIAGQGIGFKPLAARPGLVFTKSLPRTPAVFGPCKGRRGRSGTITQEDHVRGAIDIVKGLEQKRQRRREKFYQKYCTRARKNPTQTKRPVPGQGAQRMREVGLTMAGKLCQGNYVLSI